MPNDTNISINPYNCKLHLYIELSFNKLNIVTILQAVPAVQDRRGFAMFERMKEGIRARAVVLIDRAHQKGMCNDIRAEDALHSGVIWIVGILVVLFLFSALYPSVSSAITNAGATGTPGTIMSNWGTMLAIAVGLLVLFGAIAFIIKRDM